MGYESPLRGRRTGQLLLKQIPFIHTLDYVGNFERAVEFYSVFGGTPAYIIETDPENDIFTNIEDNIMREYSVLYRDVEFVLRQELTEPRYYFSILLSIAKGNHRIGKWWHKEKEIDIVALNEELRVQSSASVNGVIMSVLLKLSGISGKRRGSPRLEARRSIVWSLRRVSGRWWGERM
jgi:AAA+ ATPase superfamily predicted ATPase